MTQANQNRFAGQMVRSVIITVLLITIYRLGTQVPLPFIDNQALMDFFKSQRLVHISVFELGITPYLSAYVLVEIFSLFVPFLKKLRAGDYEGRRRLKRFAIGITLPLGILYGDGIVKTFSNITLPTGTKILTLESSHEYILLVTILVAGVFFLVFISELISKYGIGNGISILLFSGICAALGNSIKRNYVRFSDFGPGVYLVSLIIVVVIVFFIIKLLQTKISVAVNHKLLKKPVNLFQFNTCPSGTIAIFYATSIVMLPATLFNFVGGGDTFLKIFSPISFAYNLSLVLILGIISYLFAWLFFHPARRLKKMREREWIFSKSDQDTKGYLSRKLLIYNLPWTALLCGLAVLPHILIVSFNVPFYIGGSSLYIAVAIGLDILDRYNIQRQLGTGRLVKIAELHDVYDATMIKKHLESKGIISHLQGYYHRHLLYFFGPFIDISLMVGENDTKAASELLRKYYKSLGLLKL